MNYTDLTKAQQKQVVNDSGYSKEQWTSNDETLIPENELDEYLLDLFYDIYDIPDNIQTYIDDDRVIYDLKMDYSEVDIDGETHYFRAW